MIEARHLSKLYSRGLYALRDLSLTVEKGEFVFLTGPSGAGKSTFLRLLLRQELPSEGGLVVNGRNLATHIRRVLNAGSDGASMARPSAVSAGVVKSVTVSALVVAASGKDTTFAVDQETRVIGTGVGTATAAAGGRIAITSLVSAGDTVQVSYSQAAGAIRATEVRITAKAR